MTYTRRDCSIPASVFTCFVSSIFKFPLSSSYCSIPVISSIYRGSSKLNWGSAKLSVDGNCRVRWKREEPGTISSVRICVAPDEHGHSLIFGVSEQHRETSMMEVLYQKLYKKYSEEKDRKESQFDKLNRDQEVKFLNFTAAADDMIQYLTSENEKLSEQVNDLKSELASIRASSEQHVHYQNLLMEEKQKNKDLSEEITRLQEVERIGCSRCTMCKKIGSGQESSHDTPDKEIQGQSNTEMRKKRKIGNIIEGASAPYVDVEHDSPGDEDTFVHKSDGTPPIIQQPLYCQRKIYNPGADATDTNSFGCMFQYLVEFVVGMKVTPLTQSNELCILVNHQSSGYTFSLTWITNSNSEVELLYKVSSLGTFERVAPEWMKETLMFSTSMCGVFFDRISRVIKSYR